MMIIFYLYANRCQQVAVFMSESLIIHSTIRSKHCTDRSVFGINVPRERLERTVLSRGTLMLYTDRSVQRHFKSNTPNACFE